MQPLRAETLSIHGPDAIVFAHAQLASDVRQLQPGSWQWSAWLDPQGRVRALLQIMRTDEEHLLLLLRGGTAADMASALSRYVLRSKVGITALEPRQLLDAEPLPEYSLQVHGDDLIVGMGSHALRITTASGQSQHWRLAAIKAGHPWLPYNSLDALLAPALSLQRLGAISLSKGCYPGQEIVARLHYRGGGKQHLWQVESDMPLAPGSPLACAGERVGHILDGATDDHGIFQALAVLRDTVALPELTIESQEETAKISIINKL